VVIAEAALELVPLEISRDPRIISACKKRGKSPSKCLLDKSLHYWAMKGLKDAEKRGRPDLVHFTLLSLVYSPAYINSLIKIYVHTYNDVVIELGNAVRLPHAYFRFEGLMVDLLNRGEIKADGKLLLSAQKMKLCELLGSIGGNVIGFETTGPRASLASLVRETWDKGATYVIGGFPSGSFRGDHISCMDGVFSVYDSMLESAILASRLTYEIEMTEGLWRLSGTSAGSKPGNRQNAK